MKKIIKLEDGTCWIANTKTDETLYCAPFNPPNTGQTYTRGTDLYAHQTKKHGVQFYFLDWSMWQGEEEHITPVTREEAIDFLKEQVGDYWGFPKDDTIKMLQEKYDIDLMEETA